MGNTPIAVARSIADTVTLQNGARMPWVGLGTWQVPDGQPVEQSVRWALELGYRHIDTAAVYKNEVGVGRAVRESGVPREEIFVTTKVWNDDQRKGAAGVRAAFDASLQRLGFDYVDLYLVHWPVKGMYKQAWGAMQEIFASGRARAIGVSNFLVHHLRDLLDDRPRVPPMVNQVEFHPRLLQRELLQFCRDHHIVQEAWSPLMQGKAFQIQELQDLAERYERTIAQIVLRWNLQHGVVTIPKSVRRERVAENAALFDFELAPDDMARIDALDRGQRVGSDPDTFKF